MPFRRAVCRPSLHSLAALEKKGVQGACTLSLPIFTAHHLRSELAFTAPQTLPIRDGTSPPSLRSFTADSARARARLGKRPW